MIKVAESKHSWASVKGRQYKFRNCVHKSARRVRLVADRSEQTSSEIVVKDSSQLICNESARSFAPTPLCNPNPPAIHADWLRSQNLRSICQLMCGALAAASAKLCQKSGSRRRTVSPPGSSGVPDSRSFRQQSGERKAEL